MAYQYEYLEEFLRKYELELIPLEILNDNGAISSTALYQPKGDVVGTNIFVGNQNQTIATVKAQTFLKEAQKQNCSLVVTPEYCVPWSVIKEIGISYSPSEGSVWILGCESITLDELKAIKTESKFQILFDENSLETTGNFLDPLCYVVWTKKINASEPPSLSIIVQFKTHQMSDERHNLERTYLKKGNKVFVLGKPGRILLFTVICSDSLAFLDQLIVDNAYAPIIMVHIQLCYSPHNSDFKKYRNSLFGNQAGNRILLCANWAQGTSIQGVTLNQSENFGRSGVFLKLKLNLYQDQILENHRKGLYYTFCTTLRSHYCVFNYDESIYLFNMSKAGTAGVAGSGGNQMLPKLFKVFDFDANFNALETEKNDGYLETWEQGNSPEIHFIKSFDRVKKEIFINKCLGVNANSNSLNEVRSFQVDETEEIKRLTFTHDLSTNSRIFRQKFSSDFNRFISEVITSSNHFPGHSSYLVFPLSLGHWGNYSEYNLIDQNEQMITVCYIGTVTQTGEIEMAFSDLKRQYKGTDLNRVFLFYHQGNQLCCKFELNKKITKTSFKLGPNITEV